MKLFWTIWGIDLVAALVILYFFFIGLADGTVSSYNAGLCLIILAVVAAVIGGSIPLIKKGKKAAAYILLGVMAIPALLMGVFLAILMVSNVHWQ